MGELVKAAMAYLTPAESETVGMILQTDNERQLDASAFSAVLAFARGPRPQLPFPAQDEFKQLIRALAGTLKTPRTSLDQGRIQLSMYWAALRDVELFRLQLAGEHYIKTAEWMPTPGQLRTTAMEYSHPVLVAHAKARRLARDRQHREHQQLMRQISDRKLTQGELDALQEPDREAAIGAHLLVRTPEGGAVYRTAEALDAWLEHNRRLTREAMEKKEE